MSIEKSHRDRRIDYIEFNVADITRSKDFYGKAFGWTFTDFGPSYCEFSDGHMKAGFVAVNRHGSGSRRRPSRLNSSIFTRSSQLRVLGLNIESIA